MQSAAKPQMSEESWKLRFFSIWGAQLFSLLGSNLVGFALIWWITKTTGSATALATASLVGMVPQIVLGPLVGTLVDRWNRRLVMIFADGTIALATLFIAGLFWLGDVQIWQIYILMFVRSVAGGFHWPSMQASTTLMVPKEHLARIHGMNSMVGGGMSVFAAPLGALLIEFLPMHAVLGIDVVTAMIAIGPLFIFLVPQPQRNGNTNLEAGQANTTVWQEFMEGLRYVVSWKGLMMIGVLAVILNFLLTPAFSLLPILVTNHFGGKAFQLAWMNSANGLGMLTGGVALSVWGGFRKRMHTSLSGLVGMGIGATMVALAPVEGYLLALAGVFVFAFFNPLANGPLLAAVQAVVAPEKQGRVFTLIGSIAGLMSPVGLAIAGPLSDIYGVQTWFFLGAAGLFVLGIGAFFIPTIIHFEDERTLEDDLSPAEVTVDLSAMD
jgi:MFS transporter, DHA3 family, macrolide efflux protein